MMIHNATPGEELTLANTNWLLIDRLIKAGGLANTAIKLLGEASSVETANKLLVKACRDVAELVNVDKMGAQ